MGEGYRPPRPPPRTFDLVRRGNVYTFAGIGDDSSDDSATAIPSGSAALPASAAPPDQPAITSDQSAAWYNVIAQWDQYVANFNDSFAALVQEAAFIETQSPDVQSEYADMISRAEATQSQIASVQNGVADVENALQGAWQYVTGAWSNVEAVSTSAGESLLSTVKGWFGMSGAAGLGFLPLIPIAVVVASVAALAYFLTTYATFQQKITLLKQYTAQGMNPTDAAAAVQKALGPAASSITSSLGTLVLVAGGIAAIIFLPRLIGSYKGAIKS
jgi:hypothetical protein